MEAVQQRTSLIVHISHSSLPKVHSLLICNVAEEGRNLGDQKAAQYNEYIAFFLI